MHRLHNRDGQAHHRGACRPHRLRPRRVKRAIEGRLPNLKIQVGEGEDLDNVPGTFHQSAGQTVGTSTNILSREVPHWRRKQRQVNVRGVLQYGKDHSKGLCRRNQPDNGKHHSYLTIGDVRQPPLRQGGGQHGAADGHEEPPGVTQEPKVGSGQPQEFRPLQRRHRR